MVDKSAKTSAAQDICGALETNERLALEALIEGNLADAEKRLKVSEILMRQRKAKLDMEDEMKARAAHAKPVDDMSEAELRDELARLLGIETKADRGGLPGRHAPQGGEGTAQATLSPHNASGAGPTTR